VEVLEDKFSKHVQRLLPLRGMVARVLRKISVAYLRGQNWQNCGLEISLLT